MTLRAHGRESHSDQRLLTLTWPDESNAGNPGHRNQKHGFLCLQLHAIPKAATPAQVKGLVRVLSFIQFQPKEHLDYMAPLRNLKGMPIQQTHPTEKQQLLKQKSGLNNHPFITLTEAMKEAKVFPFKT